MFSLEAKPMDPYWALMVSIFVLSLKYCIGDGESCNSPQYIELEKPAIITCSLENAYAVSWYNSTVLRNAYPIVHYSASAKSGHGYISGEFDITRNGSLLINTASFRHDHYFAVEYWDAELEDAVVLNIQVIVVVKPPLPFPVIEHCEEVTGLCVQKVEDPHVRCSVENIRPSPLLELNVKTVDGNRNISFNRHTESNGKLFTSSVTTTDPFKYTSRLALIACTAHTLPGILERNEHIVLLQKNNHSVFNVEPTVIFVDLNSSLELRCSGSKIGFVVWWWMADMPNSTQSGRLLAYAVLLGNPQEKIHIQGYLMGREGSVIVPQFDNTYEGTYSCISSDGVSDTVIVYETIVFVKPLPNHLMVDGCNHEENCVLEVMNEGNLTCRVNGVRPRVQLQWKSFHGGKSISFKTQQVLIIGRNDTYDISLTSAYYAKIEPGNSVTVVCEVVGLFADHFNMATTVDLKFWKETASNQSTATTVLRKIGLITVGVVVLVLVIGVILCTMLIVTRKNGLGIEHCRRQHKMTQGIDGKETYSLLCVKASQGEVLTANIKQELIIYLKDRNESLCNKVKNLEDTSAKEHLEVLRQLCFKGINIKGDNAQQESALKLLKIASDYKINIRKVLLRDSFNFVADNDSRIMTTSGQALPTTIPIYQLDISQKLKPRDINVVKQILHYASQCWKLRLLTFSHCVLPYSFDESRYLVDLQNNNVEVCWENGIFFPKFVLNLNSGTWQYAVDGCELQHGDYLNLTSSIAEEESLSVYSKILKRTRHYSPKQMMLAQRIFHTMEECFKLHGAVTIDTPMFEMRETIVETFGRHYARAMFDISDQGEESVSLRFDLTIPFVRYITSNNLSELKRYHIGKVCRRDNLFKKGWRRGEFYKCDFDIAGEHERMLPDAECIKIACAVLNELMAGEIIVMINHQKILTGLSKLFNVRRETIGKISEFLETTPHASKDDIVQHIYNKQHINIDNKASRILHYMNIKGGKDAVERLLNDNDLFAHLENGNEEMEIDSARNEFCEGLEDLKLLYEFCEIMGVANKVRFEMGFTRPLRLYTGLFFQAALTGPKVSLFQAPTKRSGILANGGRFDKLAEKVLGGKQTVPCVGFTFDIGQLLTILETHVDKTGEVVRIKATEVMVCSNRPNMPKEILKLCTDLWNAGVRAEIANRCYQDILDKWNKEEMKCIPFIACLTGVNDQVVLARPGKPPVKETIVARSEFVSEIRKLLGNCQGPNARNFQSMTR